MPEADPQTPSTTVADRFKAALVSCGGLGNAPVASGTFGTVGAVAIVFLLWPLRGHVNFSLQMAVLSVVGMAVGVSLGGWAERYYGRKDPSNFVLDELVGYWICLIRFSDGAPGLLEMAMAFFAFRLFDVIKPPPGRQLESLPRGWGIMLDDVVAGIYANLMVWVLRDYFQWP